MGETIYKAAVFDADLVEKVSRKIKGSYSLQLRRLPQDNGLRGAAARVPRRRADCQPLANVERCR